MENSSLFPIDITQADGLLIFILSLNALTAIELRCFTQIKSMLLLTSTIVF